MKFGTRNKVSVPVSWRSNSLKGPDKCTGPILLEALQALEWAAPLWECPSGPDESPDSHVIARKRGARSTRQLVHQIPRVSYHNATRTKGGTRLKKAVWTFSCLFSSPVEARSGVVGGISVTIKLFGWFLSYQLKFSVNSKFRRSQISASFLSGQ